MLYLDSSGLVKLLVVEELLEWGWQSVENTAVATARITWVEVRADCVPWSGVTPEPGEG